MDMLIHGLAQPRSQSPHCAELYCVFLTSASWMSKKEIVSATAHYLVEISWNTENGNPKINVEVKY